MSDVETGTLQRLTELRQKFLLPLIAKNRGRLVKLMGDDLLVEFKSIVDAITCALSWQNTQPGLTVGWIVISASEC